MLFMFADALKTTKMKYIEIKSEGYTFRYDFEPIQCSTETFNPTIMVHFLCNFLGIEKAYKIETQLLVGLIQRRERDSNPRTR